ncbi:hypothetical protein FD16_GL001346 [Paucilactobacillus suebicus DSM 5007 = KCTC 3549]|uniref:Uncharacterized protein n=1 Tax=Paucilactobacillus suebicus DSM 5007 = KCTC 3549 TaxID=1423807 RepID=A0A0R1W5U6_9LACO|nr:hypothetical protein FD16_GL001346 [Paucilactobacillus suebicus DSM 5007 = KCTC 3549]
MKNEPGILLITMNLTKLSTLLNNNTEELLNHNFSDAKNMFLKKQNQNYLSR